MSTLPHNRFFQYFLGFLLLADGGLVLSVEGTAELQVVVSPEHGLAPLDLSPNTKVLDSLPAGRKTYLLVVRLRVHHQLFVLRHVSDLLLNITSNLR